MKKIIIAPVGDYMEDLFVGIREFPTEKIILIAPLARHKEALETKKTLEKFKIPIEIINIKGSIWEEVFKTVAIIKRDNEGKGEVIINVSTGSRDSRCAATSAAFVNGLKAFAVDENKVHMLPVLKFSYYSLLPKKKLEILKILYSDKTCCAALEELAKKAKMSMPLLSYHINGTIKSEGLINMGLVKTQEARGRTRIALTELGIMIVEGYVT